jgi:hypothetical protein
LIFQADVAQLVEQSIRNRQVIGSSPIVGSIHFCRFAPTRFKPCSFAYLDFRTYGAPLGAWPASRLTSLPQPHE